MSDPRPSWRISVAMATYNGSRFIQEQLDSLMAQTMPPYELVVTDDGSTDNTVEIVAAFGATADFPVRIYRNEARLGFADNFFRAGRLCSGDLVAFCDQDDKWNEEKLAICAQAFQDSDVLLCVHRSKVWFGDREADWYFPDFKRSRLIEANTADPWSVFPGFSTVIRASVLQILSVAGRPMDINSITTNKNKMAHDQWIWFMSSIFGKIHCEATTLALYRQHDENVCGAGENRRGIKTLLLAMRSLNYRGLADLSEEYGRFLESGMPLLPVAMHCNARIAVDKFRRRAQLQRLRAQIYDDSVGVVARLRAFLKILCVGGYRPDPARVLFGPRAALKDIMFGVPGVFRFRI